MDELNPNEAAAESQEERDAEALIEKDLTPAEHWSAIKELMATIEIQAKDLAENVEKLQADSLNIFPF